MASIEERIAARRAELAARSAESEPGQSADGRPKWTENIWGAGEADTPGERLGQTLNDMGRAAGSGVVRGATALADLPGTLLSAPNTAAFNAAERAGLLSPEMAEAGRRATPYRPDAFRDIATQAAPGVMQFEPETVAGDYAQNVGEFVPATVLTGGSLPIYAAGAGITSEFLGRWAEGKTVPDVIPLIGGDDLEPYARFAGAVAGPAMIKAGQSAITPNPADPVRVAAADRLKAEGVPVTAGQRTGKTPLRYREEMAGRTSQMIDDQADEFTSVVLKRAGIDARRAEIEVLDEAGERLGTIFDELAARNKITMDAPLARATVRAVRTYEKNTSKDTIAPVIRNISDKILAKLKSRKPITGAEYQRWRSELGHTMKMASQGNKDVDKMFAAVSMRKALDEAMGRTLKASGRDAEYALYETVRRQYADLMAIRKAASAGGENAALGIISPAQLRMAVGRNDYGKGSRELAKLARDGSAVFAKTRGGSPTQAKQAATSMDMVSGVAPGGISAAATYGLTKDPGLAAMAGAAGAMMPSARNALTATPIGQAYLGNQLLTDQLRLLSPQMLGPTISALGQKK